MEHEMPATLTGLENLQFCPGICAATQTCEATEKMRAWAHHHRVGRRIVEIMSRRGAVRAKWLERSMAVTWSRSMSKPSPFRYFKTSPAIIRLAGC